MCGGVAADALLCGGERLMAPFSGEGSRPLDDRAMGSLLLVKRGGVVELGGEFTGRRRRAFRTFSCFSWSIVSSTWCESYFWLWAGGHIKTSMRYRSSTAL